MPISRQVGSLSRTAADAASTGSDTENNDLVSAVLSKAGEFLTGTELSRARYSFHTETDAVAQWLVSHIQVSESVCGCYAANIQLVSPEGDQAESLLGKGCTLTIERDDCTRQVHGIVTRVVPGAINKTGSSALITVVPALQALAQRTNSRIFQDKTVPEVLDLVLAPALTPYKRKHEARLRRSNYLTREYIVQYRETDLEFVERLMAEEGIWYYFEHPDGFDADKVELMVLVDTNDDAQTANLGHCGDELPMQLDHTGKTYWQAVTDFSLEHQMSSSSLQVREYNWTNPGVVELKTMPSDDVGDRPLYEPHDLHFAGYADKKFSKFDTADQARMRWERMQTQAQRAHGRANLVGLMPGQKIKVSGQASELNGEWIVLSLEARGRDAKNLEQDVDALEDYSASFVCARAELPYRPEPRSRHRVQGIQTATVVGPTGKSEAKPGEDDIHTDEHGRIQVKMSWDRTQPGDADATVTCFLRVAQGWGGSGWGFMFIPRIGMEVIVNFIDGDADQPVVTGCLYNGLNRPSPDLPAHKTKSYIRSQSTPSGKGANELQFDDADGKQQVYIHAQRDFNEVVEHNQSTQVKVNQSLTVGGSRNKTVSGDESATIEKTRTHTVLGNEKLTVDKGSSRTLAVTGDQITTIDKTRTLTVTQGDAENFNGGRVINVKTSDELNVTDNANKTDHITGAYKITGEKQFTVLHGPVGSAVNTLDFKSDGLELNNAGFTLSAGKDGTTTITVSKALNIKVGDATISLTSTGAIEINGKQQVKLTSGGKSTVTATPASIAVDTETAQISGQTLTAIKGGLVTIN